MSCTVRNQAGRGVCAEPGMARRNHPEAAGQPVEKGPVLRDIVAAVQEQQRRAVPGRQHLERGFADFDAFHPILLTRDVGAINRRSRRQ